MLEPSTSERDTAVTREKERTNTWWRVFLIGLGLFGLSLGALYVTRNPNLFPATMTIGNLLIPVTYVTFFYDRRHATPRGLGLKTVVGSFLYGGVLGIVAAAILEPLFIAQLDFRTSFIVGLIEEFAKILGVMVIARNRLHTSALGGLILGAAAGMGFAALESMGYTFTSFLRSDGNLSAAVSVTLLRGVLSPLGHGTWTAILAAVLFLESAPKRFRLTWKVLGAYLLVSALHGLWNGMPGIMNAIMPGGSGIVISQMGVGIAGLLTLWATYRQARRRAADRQSEYTAAEAARLFGVSVDDEEK